MVEQGPTGKDEQTALQVGASSWHQPGRALESVSCREQATGKSNKSLRNSTVQFTHGLPSIISKLCQTDVLKMGGNHKRRGTLSGVSTSVVARGRTNKQQKAEQVWCDVSHLSVKTLRSDKGPTPETNFFAAFHHPEQLHTLLGRQNTTTIPQQVH